jgi:hypothetical protein
LAAEQNPSTQSTVRNDIAAGGVVDGFAIDAQERGDFIGPDYISGG